MLKGPHQRLVLLPFDKAVVGDAVHAEMQAVFFAEHLQALHEAHHVGRNAIHIQRQAEHDGIRVPELFEY